MYRKGRDEQRLPFRFSWSYDAEKYAESLGFKLCYTTLGFKLKNKAL